MSGHSFGGDNVPWPWASWDPQSGLRPAGPETPFPLLETKAPNGAAAASSVLGRGTYKAFRLGAQIAIQAEGNLPNHNDRADIVQMPWRILPPQFALFFVQAPISLPAVRPFRVVEVFGYPSRAAAVTVRDADGRHVVPIEDLAGQKLSAANLAPSEDGQLRVGYSRASLQDAFDAAVQQFSPPTDVADALVTYVTRRSGKVEGGIAGVELYFVEVESSGSGMR